MHRRISARRSRVRRLVSAAAIAALVALPLPYVAAATTAAPAAPDELWSPTDHSPRATSADDKLRVNPRKYEAFTLNRDAMAARLDEAPNARGRGGAEVIAVPAPNGELVEFAVREAPVMESRLAAKHPEIRTYAGRGVEDPSATIRLDLTPMGFHASVRGDASQGAWYVDPAYNKATTDEDSRRYLSYLGSELPAPDKRFAEDDVEGVAQRLAPAIAKRAETEVKLRTYRLALVTDPSYARYFGTENVLAEKATLMNRVNQIYNDDFAIDLLLVNGTEKLNLDTVAKAVKPGGPCGAARCFRPADLETCGGGTLDRNGVVLGQLIGAGRYDIGHVALGVNGGGIAGLGVVGGPGKAVGCTGLPTPEGDFYAIDYVAHEMGHQFGANHTFNGTQGACSGGNRNAGTSVEPGSGSSVMAYAGICDSDDLQPHTDPYFSHRSIDEATAYVSSKQKRLNELQTVSLRKFNKGNDAFKLRIGGKTTRVIKRSSYRPATIKKRLERVLGKGTVNVSGWGGVEEFGDAGFSVAFTGERSGKNQRPLSVVAANGDVTGFVGETRHGGPNGNGGAVSGTENHAPVVDAPSNKRIPLQTPFTLEAIGADDDDDAVTYSWEQNDRGAAMGTGLMKAVKKNGPLFRVFGQAAKVTPAGTLQYNSPGENHTSGDPARTFPDSQQIMRGNTNAATGKCPKSKGARKTACHSEWLPTSDYTGRKKAELNFRVTARDHSVGAGGTAYDDVTLKLARKTGPFIVESLAEPGSAVRGTRTQQIQWQVNGTNKKALAQKVRITLSTDGGKTFDTELARSTKNDGRANVTWPNIDTEKARIKVEAVGNYFFSVNAADFTIVAVQ